MTRLCSDLVALGNLPRNCGAVLLVLGLLGSSGCQTWGPTGGLGLGAFGEEAHIKKLAAQDAFPSPEDVGLTSQ